MDFHKAALKENGSQILSFHFQIPGSLAITKDPWSRNRPKVNFQKAALKRNGSQFLSFHFQIPGSIPRWIPQGSPEGAPGDPGSDLPDMFVFTTSVLAGQYVFAR